MENIINGVHEVEREDGKVFEVTYKSDDMKSLVNEADMVVG